MGGLQKHENLPKFTLGVTSAKGQTILEVETVDVIGPHLLLLDELVPICFAFGPARRSKLCGLFKAAQAIILDKWRCSKYRKLAPIINESLFQYIWHKMQILSKYWNTLTRSPISFHMLVLAGIIMTPKQCKEIHVNASGGWRLSYRYRLEAQIITDFSRILDKEKTTCCRGNEIKIYRLTNWNSRH